MARIYEPLLVPAPTFTPAPNPIDTAVKVLQDMQDRKIRQQQLAQQNQLYGLKMQEAQSNMDWAAKERARTEANWNREEAFKKDVAAKADAMRAEGITDPTQIQIGIFRDLAPTYGDLPMFQQGLQHARTLKEFQPSEEIVTINGRQKKTRKDPITNVTTIVEEETDLTGRAAEDRKLEQEKSMADIARVKAETARALRPPATGGAGGAINRANGQRIDDLRTYAALINRDIESLTRQLQEAQDPLSGYPPEAVKGIKAKLAASEAEFGAITQQLRGLMGITIPTPTIPSETPPTSDPLKAALGIGARPVAPAAPASPPVQVIPPPQVQSPAAYVQPFGGDPLAPEPPGGTPMPADRGGLLQSYLNSLGIPQAISAYEKEAADYERRRQGAQ